jgi:poly(3-hydroxybutyrate) depolymerase
MRVALRLPIALLSASIAACGGAPDDGDTTGAGGSSQAGSSNESGGSLAQAGSTAQGGSAQGGSTQGGSGQGGSSQGGSSMGGAAVGGNGGSAHEDGGMPSGDAATSDSGPAVETCPMVDAGPTSAHQTAKQLGSMGAPNGFLEYLPPCYDKAKAMPLLVFWHGIGEDGNGTTDLNKLTAWGPPKLIANNNWDPTRPFIVLSPQYTATNGNIAPGGGCPSSDTINKFITWALGNYDVDKRRVYLTGLSCGAIGSWDYLANFQGTVVAAAVLLSGNPGDPTQAGSAWKRAGCSLGSAAIWSLHGDKDGTVPYAPDEATLQNLMACPAPPRKDARFTDVKNGDHVIWDPIYDLSGGDGDIYEWMLTNAKP